MELEADVELGGSDQLFNLTVGRELQRQAGQKPQVCLTTPLLVGVDGSEKMSKSLGNSIGVTDSPRDMFGKCMSVPDECMRDYFTLVTDVPEREVEALLAGHPRQAKVALARAITADFHGAERADAAVAEFDRIFRSGGQPDAVPKVQIQASELRDGAIQVAAALSLAGLCGSSSEGRRLIKGKGVKVDGEVVTDASASLASGGTYQLQAGKRKFADVTVG